MVQLRRRDAQVLCVEQSNLPTTYFLALLPWLLFAVGGSAHLICCCWHLQALVRWGGAMLELAHFKQGEEADECIQEVRQHVRWKTQTHICTRICVCAPYSTCAGPVAACGKCTHSSCDVL